MTPHTEKVLATSTVKQYMTIQRQRHIIYDIQRQRQTIYDNTKKDAALEEGIGPIITRQDGVIDKYTNTETYYKKDRKCIQKSSIRKTKKGN